MEAFIQKKPLEAHNPKKQLWLFALSVLLILLNILSNNIYPFLAPDAPVNGQIAVVAGWMPDKALAKTAERLAGSDYQLILTSGGELEYGSLFSEYPNYAELAKATLQIDGVDSAAVIAVPAQQTVKAGEIAASAVAVRTWLAENRPEVTRFDLFAPGPQARRARLIFHRTLGDSFEIGVISIPLENVPTRKWGRSGEGLRVVGGELLALLHDAVPF